MQLATVAAAAGALGALSGCLQESESLQEAAGEAAGERYFYNSICHGCACSCPVRVYLQDGVVVKIEGHPDAPVSMGSLCPKGLNQIHTCYSPRRILYPMKRTGPRGIEGATFERISWDEAIDLAATKIAETIEKYGTYSFFCSIGGGGTYIMLPITSMSAALGSPTHFEPGDAQCYMPRTGMAQWVYGGDDQSMTDSSVLEPFKGLSKLEAEKGIQNDTNTLVIWGQQPTVSQCAQAARGLAELRERGCKTVVVDPNFSPDAVKATVHLPVRPGSDTALVLAWYRVILDEKLYDEEFTKYWTNMPFLINPETHLPWLATEAIPGYVPPENMPDNTPVYVCVDEDTGEVAPLPFGDPAEVSQQVNPQVLATAVVNGLESRSAGQIYRDEAEPWTLERAEEFCWVPAERIREAIDIYTAPLKEGKCAGICHGVATDQQEDSHQMTLGLLGLDCIMGYVNKPGCTLTQNGNGPKKPVADAPSAANQWGKCVPDGVLPRPVAFTGLGGMYASTHGAAYQIGAGDAANEARVNAVPEAYDPDSGNPPFLVKNQQWLFNQLIIDHPGFKNHRGQYTNSHAHIPSIREHIETGEPFRPRVWFDGSGNKLAALASAGVWYNAIMNGEMDFIIGEQPMLTSFHMEMADLVFPTQEWLEATNVGDFNGQANYFFPVPGVIHLGESAPMSAPPLLVTEATAKKLNEKLDSIVFGNTGKTIGELGLSFPLGAGIFDAVHNDDEAWANLLEKAKMMPGAENVATKEEYLEFAKNNSKAYYAYPSDEFWLYGQHLVKADDGLPLGFATESRKCEVYATVLIRSSKNGYPFAYPNTVEKLDPRIGSWDGHYAPICVVTKQKEAPKVENCGEWANYDPDFPLAITSGRVYFFHHGTMRHAPFARELYPAPFVRINSRTAAEYGIEHGDWVEISSRRTAGTDYDPAGTTGSEMSYSGIKEHNTKVSEPIRAIAYVSELVAPNVLWMERYWNPECYDSSQQKKTGGWQECNINVITNGIDANFNEVYGSYNNRAFCVSIKKSTKPENVWTQPAQFEPFMPTNENQYLAEIGVLRDNADLRTEPPALSVQ